MDAKQTPLIDLLERVPADARMVYGHDQFHSQNIPVGRLCNEAAAALRAASCDEERSQLWEAGPGGGCARALSAEFKCAELLEALKAITAAPDLRTYGLAMQNACIAIARAEGAPK
jgi:hypothetical protein